MTPKLLLPLLLGLWLPSIAQKAPIPLRVGLFLPYGTQIGVKVGTWHQLTNWEENDRAHQLWLSPQAGFFAFPRVENTFLLNADLEYQFRRGEKRVFPRVAVGVGYMLARERVDGSVDLSSGDITHATRSLHYLVPSAGLGLGILPTKRFGYHIMASYGRRIGLNVQSEAYVGLEVGVTIPILSK